MSYVQHTLIPSWITRDVSLGNILLLLGMLGSLASGLWEAGMIRASLEDAIHSEREMRVADTAALGGRIDGMREDVRELRSVLLDGRAPAVSRGGHPAGGFQGGLQ